MRAIRLRRLQKLQAMKYPDWLRYGNLALAFLTELGALLGFAMAGMLASGWLQLVAGAAGVVAFVVLWGIFAAPRSKRRLKGLALVGFKVGMFAVAVLILVLAGFVGWAALLAVLVAINLGLATVLRQH